MTPQGLSICVLCLMEDCIPKRSTEFEKENIFMNPSTFLKNVQSMRVITAALYTSTTDSTYLSIDMLAVASVDKSLEVLEQLIEQRITNAASRSLALNQSRKTK